MKWFLFALALAGTIPFTLWLRHNPRQLPKVLMAIGALPLVMGGFPKYEIAILGAPEWPGSTQGYNVSILDLIVVATYFSLPRGKSPLPFKIPFLLYIGVVLLSAFQATVPTATLYYAWQLLRMFMVYAVVARVCEDPQHTVYVLKGMALGLCFQASWVLWQRFVVHYLYVTGTYAHQNTLGLVTHFIVFPFFALLLSGQREWQPAAIPVLGVLIDIISASRASLAFTGIGFSLLFLLSVVRRWTARKARVLVAALLVLVLLLPLAYRQFELRFGAVGQSFQLSESGGRAELNESAQLILSDFPMGVGANNFVVFANVNGYYERANVGDKNRNTFPHNIYWTTAAETGYLGLLAFLVFLFTPLFVALSCGWRNRKDSKGDLLLGLATSLMVFYVHSYLEWIFFHDLVQYLFVLDVGIIAGVAQQLGYWSRTKAPARLAVQQK